MYIVPLTTSPNQTFTSTIPIDGNKIKFYFFLRYNTEQNCWEMDISNSNKEPLINSIPLVCGSNLLEQYSYLNIGSAYIVKTDTNISGDKPNDKNLGSTFILVWGDTK
ncbi:MULTISPECIES: phage baseplate plug family protein [Bacillota]|uniref:phage baseplate plug family protein n=1 Tax=Bacillota TaxID=1239 RepID=UPI0024315B3A|nr:MULTISPECIES: hypothetical protein [Bacillota]MBS5330570.1 hypothetical protein [Limosilactobacillus oris]MDU4846132.1 hypothetical protein [Clostridium sp.]CAI3574414.1 conserved hypothetical protein [Clostridium neonatale]CAI3648275.1 conserved hypothetical protein [Clostridium neonatale]CAI3658100.1 conserved hypothetical protein [Clostridium neonatale]